jgi:hypothetical protein
MRGRRRRRRRKGRKRGRTVSTEHYSEVSVVRRGGRGSEPPTRVKIVRRRNGDVTEESFEL